MDRIGTKTWMTIGTVGIVVFFSYWMRFSKEQTYLEKAAQVFSYVMPRPRNFEPGFDLSDRTVDRRYKTLPALPSKKAPVIAKVDPKKAAADAAAAAKLAKKTADAKKAAAQAQALARKKKMEVKLVDTSRAQMMSPNLTVETLPDSTPVAASPGSLRNPNPTPTASTPDDTKSTEDTLTVAQWRSLLQTSPTAANIAKFIKAKQAGDIDSASYYQIVHELLVDSADDRKKAALAILDQDVSASTFSFMVTQKLIVPTDLQTSLETRIESYSQVAKFGYLIKVLQASSQPVVLEAAEARVEVALTAYKTNATQATNTATTTTGGRNVASTLTAQQFTALIPTLQKLAKNTDATLAASAKQLLSEVQGIATAQTAKAANPTAELPPGA